jgi:hypothetical protein
MATVRINQQIRYHVSQELSRLFDARIKAKREELHKLGIAEAVYEAASSEEERQLAYKLQNYNKWFDPQTHVNVRIEWKTNKAPCSHVFHTAFVTAQLLPVTHTQRYHIFQLEPEHAPYKAAVAICEEANRMEFEKQELHTKLVKGVLEQCSTLRQVLEVWPTALDFMPEDVRRQHGTKAEKRVNPTVNIDIDETTKIALMKARLSQGAVS